MFSLQFNQVDFVILINKQNEIFSSCLGLMYIVHIFAYYAIFMTKNYINRIRVVLAEKNIANKSLAEKMKKSPTTVSRWCNNEMQPSLETLVEIASQLDVDVRELINPTK